MRTAALFLAFMMLPSLQGLATEGADTRRERLLATCTENEAWMDTLVYKQRRDAQCYAASAAAVGALSAGAGIVSGFALTHFSAREEHQDSVFWSGLIGGSVTAVLGAVAAGLGAYSSFSGEAASDTLVNAYLELQKAKNTLEAAASGSEDERAAMATAAEKCIYTPRGAVTNADLDKASKAAEKYTESLKKSLAFLEEKGEAAANALDEIENDPNASESKKNLAKTKSLELKRMLEKSAELRKRMSSMSPATLQAGEQADAELDNALKAAEDIQQLK